jgi:[ribosomal protein S5]-alanine N-acetyltransferase
MYPSLETVRLLLREIKDEDTEVLYDYFSQDVVTQYFGMNTFTQLDEAKMLIQRFRETSEQNRGYRWGIVLKETNTFIGTIGFHTYIPTHKRAEVGYELHPTYWNKGYMTEALKAVLTFCFEKLNLQRIGAIVFQENMPSNTILQKMQFTREGLLRDYIVQNNVSYDGIVYSILKEEWQNRIK